MRIATGGRTLRGVPGSLTRRQLLIRTGGATVALTCFGALPGGAAAEPAALSSARAATYARDPRRASTPTRRTRSPPATSSSRGFAERYAGDESLRAYADAVLDAIERAPFATLSPARGPRAARGLGRNARSPMP